MGASITQKYILKKKSNLLNSKQLGQISENLFEAEQGEMELCLEQG